MFLTFHDKDYPDSMIIVSSDAIVAYDERNNGGRLYVDAHTEYGLQFDISENGKEFAKIIHRAQSTD
jgi:hypothetical protein